jgi:hypothetical protein
MNIWFVTGIGRDGNPFDRPSAFVLLFFDSPVVFCPWEILVRCEYPPVDIVRPVAHLFSGGHPRGGCQRNCPSLDYPCAEGNIGYVVSAEFKG